MIKDSKGNIFNFHQRQESDIYYTIYSDDNKNIKDSTLLETGVLEYSSCIDRNDKIHLIALLEDGSLTYLIYSNENWSKNLMSKLNIKSNIYKNLTLYIVNDSIHIFYAYSNLINPNIWSIQHIVGNKNKWDKKIVINTVVDKTLNPFFIDSDKLGNIHLVYRAFDQVKNHIYYTYFNTYQQKWNQYPEKLSSGENSLFPFFFVDNKDNLHLLWNKLVNKDYILCYKRLSSMGQDKYKWKTIKIPTIKNCSYTPIIFEDGRILRLVYFQGEKISSIYSTNYGYTWEFDEEENIFDSAIEFIKYSTTFKEDNIKGKINYAFCEKDSLGNILKIYFHSSFNYPLVHLETNNEISNLENNNIINEEAINDTSTPKEILEEKTNELDLYNIKAQKEIIELVSSLIQSSEQILFKVDEIQNEISDLRTRIQKIEKRKLFNFFK